MARRRTDDDFRVACGFFAHPKTKKLRRRLGDAGVIDLLKLWAWATQNRHDGNLSGLSDEDLEDAIDRTEGTPGHFIAALAELRWIDGPPGNRILHEWFEHNPYAATKGARVEKAKKAAEASWASRRAQQPDLPLDAPEDDDPPPPVTTLNRPDATSIKSDAPSIPNDAPSNAQSGPEQCPPHHTTPHHTTESVARAHEAAPDSKSHIQALATALQQAGCAEASEHNPVLIRAAVEGVDGPALVALAKEKAGKSLGYLLATLRGRLADAAGMAGFPSHSVHTSAGQGSSPARESEDPETAARKARDHWRNLGYNEAEIDDLMVIASPKTTQGAIP